MTEELPVLERLQQHVSIPARDVQLDGTLAVPRNAHSVVVFAHSSGSGRRSPRNRLVAEILADASLAMLLIDLLTPAEDCEDAETGELRFDVPLLAWRLLAAFDWLEGDARTQDLSVGLLGASTGAAAALVAAEARPDRVGAVVSRGGRPDLAEQVLPHIEAPTLLIVGGEDHPTIEANQRALHALRAPKELEVVLGATHLFEEPGALELVGELARDWFLDHLAPPRGQPPNPGGSSSATFRDRSDAGEQLAGQLHDYAGRPGLLVLGLPRGGVPVAFEVARSLEAPLDVLVVRKLGVPGHEELAMGAIASGGVRVMNEDVVGQLELSEEAVAAVAADEQRELERREVELRGGEPAEPVEDRTAILVDDGLATGASMRAAVRALRAQRAGRVVVGVPIASPNVCAAFEHEVDEIVCARTPEPFGAVGAWYQDFSQTTDEEVRALLEQARAG